MLRKSKRLTIRPLKLSDYKAWLTAHTNRPAKPVSPFDFGPPKNLTREAFKKRCQLDTGLSKADIIYRFGAFETKSGLLVGNLDLAVIMRMRSQSVNLGYEIFPQFCGRGYATEAAKALCMLAFKELKIHRIEASANPANRKSLSVIKKLGMRHEGTRLKHIFINGTWEDSRVYAMTSEMVGLKNVKPSLFASPHELLERFK